MVGSGITQGELHIGIVIGQLWEILHHLLEEARLERRPGDPDGEHRERLWLEQVTPFGPGQGNRDGLLLHKAPQVAQARSWTSGIKGDWESLLQAITLSIIAQQPQDHPALGISKQVKQPASVFHPQSCSGG
jgi:hypothetical protein